MSLNQDDSAPIPLGEGEAQDALKGVGPHRHRG